MASRTIPPEPIVFYCYASISRNRKAKENTLTFAVKDAQSKETKYTMQGTKPDKSQIASTTLRLASPPEHTCVETTISPLPRGNPDMDSITGRPLTHRLSSGVAVTEVPVTGYWRPRTFEVKGGKYVWLTEGLQTRFYEYSSSRSVKKRKSTATEFETVKPAVASRTVPFWAGLCMSRYLEVRVVEEVEEAVLEVVLAGALTETMTTMYRH